MRKQFIAKQGASNYYLVSGPNQGCGGFLDPPGRATHTASIQEFRGGTCTGIFCLDSIVRPLDLDEIDWVPRLVKQTARYVIGQQPGNPRDEAWIESVYRYFHNCYSPDGVDTRVEYAVIPGQNYNGPPLPKEHSLAYLFVKKFDANHILREDLL